VWLGKAQEAMGYTKSEFKPMVEEAQLLISQAESEWRFLGIPPNDGVKSLNQQREILIKHLKMNDRVSLLSAWFAVENVQYVPALGQKFSSWKIPSNELEFDHRGSFHRVTSSIFLCEAGESKSSPGAGTTHLHGEIFIKFQLTRRLINWLEGFLLLI
jgi:hypothetical protein